jgi:hypothetical protein
MHLVRTIALSLAFLAPASLSVARAAEPSTAEPAGDQQPKKAKKMKKSKGKKGGEKGTEEKNPS